MKMLWACILFLYTGIVRSEVVTCNDIFLQASVSRQEIVHPADQKLRTIIDEYLLGLEWKGEQDDVSVLFSKSRAVVTQFKQELSVDYQLREFSVDQVVSLDPNKTFSSFVKFLDLGKLKNKNTVLWVDLRPFQSTKDFPKIIRALNVSRTKLGFDDAKIIVILELSEQALSDLVTYGPDIYSVMRRFIYE